MSPLRQENVTTTLLLGTLALLAVGTIIGIVLVAIFSEDKAGAAATMIIGVAGSISAALVALLRSEIDRHQGQAERTEIKDSVEKTQHTTETVAQRTGVVASAVQKAAIHAGEAARKAEQVQQEIRDGVLAAVVETRDAVRTIKEQAASGEVIDRVAEHVRSAAREQAVRDLRNCPDLRALLVEAGREGALAAVEELRREKT